MENSKSSDAIIEELKRVGIRPSSVRVLVLKYLRETKNHPTIDQLYSDMLELLPGLSRTSVYNTVNILKESGLVDTLVLKTGETRYDAIVKSHGHFKCDACGRLFDFDTSAVDFPGLLPEGFMATGESLVVRGLCSDCAKGGQDSQ